MHVLDIAINWSEGPFATLNHTSWGDGLIHNVSMALGILGTPVTLYVLWPSSSKDRRAWRKLAQSDSNRKAKFGMDSWREREL